MPTLLSWEPKSELLLLGTLNGLVEIRDTNKNKVLRNFKHH